MIDNLDELMQYVQEQYRTVVGQVESVLKEWAESVGGIFKEYERERYIFIFEAAHVREFIENKFDILDRVRNIKIGEGNMPVTISIGISSSFGGLGRQRPQPQETRLTWRCKEAEIRLLSEPIPDWSLRRTEQGSFKAYKGTCSRCGKCVGCCNLKEFKCNYYGS